MTFFWKDNEIHWIKWTVQDTVPRWTSCTVRWVICCKSSCFFSFVGFYIDPLANCVTSNGKLTVFTDEKFKQKLKRKMGGCSFFLHLCKPRNTLKKKRTRLHRAESPASPSFNKCWNKKFNRLILHCQSPKCR